MHPKLSAKQGGEDDVVFFLVSASHSTDGLCQPKIDSSSVSPFFDCIHYHVYLFVSVALKKHEMYCPVLGFGWMHCSSFGVRGLPWVIFITHGLGNF